MEKNSANIGRIICFGLSEEQNALVQNYLPAKGYELLVTDCPTDLIAINASALIIYAPSLDSASVEMIFDYYTEVGNSADETVIWLGAPEPPKVLRKVLKCYDSFDSIADNLKYHLLTAHRKSRKSRDFSKQLADGLLILSLIRKNPGIKTQELAERTNLNTRTVQRYITALQQTGEWLEYDTAKRGWYLQYGASILFGDEPKDM